MPCPSDNIGAASSEPTTNGKIEKIQWITGKYGPLAVHMQQTIVTTIRWCSMCHVYLRTASHVLLQQRTVCSVHKSTGPSSIANVWCKAAVEECICKQRGGSGALPGNGQLTSFSLQILASYQQRRVLLNFGLVSRK